MNLILSPRIITLVLVALFWEPLIANAAGAQDKSHNQKVAAAWFAGWHATEGYPVSKVSWSKYTHITYAFGETTPDGRSLSLEGSNPDVLPQFVREARRHGVKALVSVGGWTGSRYFSANIGNPANRTTFVKTLVNFARKYELDGLDFDWEYPGRQGIGCNVLKPEDTANFQAFLQELRKDPFGGKLILTAAAATVPFAGPDGNPLKDVSAFSKLLDYIAIMNYDIWGPWSATVGPNAPLDDSCADPSNRFGSAVSAIDAWIAAGIPANRLVLAVPGYGHGFRVPRENAFVGGGRTPLLAPYPAFNGSDRPTGDSWDNNEPFDVCGAPQPPAGTFNFWGLIENGFLKKDGTPATNKGIAYRWDSCSQTPYVYNQRSQIMVSYDDAQSFAAKGALIQRKGVIGFALWEAGGDYNDILLDAIRRSAGFSKKR